MSDEVIEESNLVKHAKRELELLGEEQEVVDAYMKIVKIFSDMGHSGSSGFIYIRTLNRLLLFENLTGLTDDPDEWFHHTEEVWGEPGGIWQNVRNGEAFSSDGGKTYTLMSDDKDPKKRPLHTSVSKTLPEGSTAE